MNRINYTTKIQLILTTLILICLSGKTAFTQSVTCPECSTGICEGENLANYITISGYPPPITINDASGAVSGTGSNLSDYIFADNSSSITMQFTDGNSNVHDETIPVTVNTINANYNYSQAACLTVNFNAGSSSSSGSIISYSWTITRTVDGTTIPITILGGANATYTFQNAGIYQVCLDIIDNNGCSDQVCQSVNVSGVDALLAFYEDGDNLLDPAVNNPYLISYCNVSTNQDFDLYMTNVSNQTGGGSITNYEVLLDGNTIYNAPQPPDNELLSSQSAGFSGYLEVSLIITYGNGCQSTTTYQVYLGQNILPQFTAQIASIDLNCPEEEIEIQTNISQQNPDGVEYNLLIVCDPTDLSSPLQSWTWNQTTPDPFVYWTPPQSSCGCVNNSYYLVTTATHPCNPTPLPDQVDFQVALPSDADFTQSPAGNLCDAETAQFTWNFASSTIPGVVWCQADADWTITDTDGNDVPINGTISDELISHTFAGPGVYEVCLQLYSICGEPQHCETVCVNPSIDDVVLNPVWNIPDTLCPDDAFTSSITYTDLAYCSTPELTWNLYHENSLIETFTGLSANVQSLEQGNYTLEATLKLEDCGELSVEENFEVFAPPVITPQIAEPYTAACAGDEICLDDWFCIDNSGIPITEFEIRIYEGLLTDCPPDPSAALLETITTSPPTPPYADCDPNPANCAYPWTAVSGQYTLWIKAENHCGPDYACITIDIPVPEIPIITGDTEVCLDSEVNLAASLPGGSFEFVDCPNGTCPTPGSGDGQYTLAGTELSWTTADGVNPPGDYLIAYSGNCTGTGTFTITLNALPEFNIIANPGNTLCADEQLTLDIEYLGVNPLDHCQWVDLNSGTTLSASACEVTIDPEPGSSDYQITAIDENGCQTSNTIQIDELTQPFSLDCSAIETAYCANVGATIDLNSLLSPYPVNGVLEWQLDGVTLTGNSVDLDGLAQGSHNLSYSWNHPLPPNCNFEDACTFDISAPTVPTITVDPEFCAGDEVTLSVNVPGDIAGNWNFESCPGTCPGIFNSSDFSLSWTTNATTPAGTYTVSYSGDCLEYQEISFQLNPIPDFSITSNALSGLCGGDTLYLGVDYSGSEAITCEWTNENTGEQITSTDCSITDNPTDPSTSYSVVVSDSNTCSQTQSIAIPIQAQPFTFNCSTIQSVYCDNEVAEIDLDDLIDISPSTAGFTWLLDGDALSENTVNLEPLNPGDYTLAFEFVHSQAPYCTFQDSCSFTISPLTTPTISGNDPVCAGTALDLSISGTAGFSGTWIFTSAPGSLPANYTSTSSTLHWQTDTDTESGSYTVSYSGPCLEAVSYSFEVFPVPAFDISVLPATVICSSDSIDLSIDYLGNGAVESCVWTDSEGAIIPSQDCAVNLIPQSATDLYFVEVTDTNTCAAIDSVEIFTQQQPFSFDCTAISASYCANENETIDFSDLVSIASDSDFEWFLDGNPINQNSLDLEPLAASPTPYILSFIYTHPDAPHCTFRDSCSFSITELTQPSVIGQDAICANDTLNLTSANTGDYSGEFTFIDCPNSVCPTNFSSDSDALTWNTDSDLNPSGTYQIQYTGTCLDTVVFAVEINPLPPFSVTTLPGETVCVDDEITISFDYQGTSQVETCTLSDTFGSSLPPTGNCTWTLLPEDLEGPYMATLTDANACANEQSFDIDIQQQPFTFSCASIDTTYCDNATNVIALDDLIAPSPATGTFEWYLNGTLISTPSIAIFDLDPGDYALSYSFIHGDAPHCTFTDTCSFTVTPLVVPQLESALAFCESETISITASGLNGFAGTWTNTDCPEPPCTLEGDNPDVFTVQSTDLAPGTYTMQYSGLCLATTTIDFEILENPTVQWTPEDATPCLNECFAFTEDVLEDYTDFGWEYSTINDQGALMGNEVCFPQINNPQSVDICLWATLDHPVQDTVFTCRVEDCNEIYPVSSPGNHPLIPEIACPGEILEIDVDYALYDDCTFVLNDSLMYENCNSIAVAEQPYGSFPYDLFLFYEGCTDTLPGDIFIPEPPSAELEVSYDECIADALVGLNDLRGDLLTFNWDVTDNPGNDFDFLMVDDNGEIPNPNPVPISNLNLISDSTFYIRVTIGNVCESIVLEDTVNYISKPDIEIDIENVAGTQFCLPQDFYFEIGEFATDFIDSVQWTFQSIYDYGNIESITYPNYQFPPPLTFTDNGIPDSVTVSATAWNQCGSDTSSINFTLVPPDLYLEMPDYAEGVCPGNSITIPSLLIEGDPFDGCEVTATPNIPGLQYSCLGSTESISVTIPATTPPGTYTLQTTIFGCGTSTDYTEMEVFPVPDVDFTMTETACTDAVVPFVNQTTGASSFEWNFDDPASAVNTSELPNPTHIFALPGDYEVNLIAYTDTGCSAEYTRSIGIHGPNPEFTLDNTVICSGDSIFTEVEAQDDIISLEWQMLLPGKDTLIFTVQNSVQNTFFNTSDSLQRWLVSLEMEDIHGCKSSAAAEVIVLPQPFARFTVGDLNGCAQGLPIQMINQSTPGTMSKWNFDDPDSDANVSYERNPTHSFSGNGEYAITLFVQNSYGCQSEYTLLLGCSGLIVYVPNAFTPDENRINEIFKPVIQGIHDIDFTVDDYYTFEVYDRWGQLMFSTDDPDKGWSGHSPNTDYYAESDVYIWQVHIEFPEGARKWQGSVTLVR